MAKIKSLPPIVFLGLAALALLYCFSIYQNRPKQSPQNQEVIHPEDLPKAEQSDRPQGQQRSDPPAQAAQQMVNPDKNNQEEKQFAAMLNKLLYKLPRKGFAANESSNAHGTPKELVAIAIEFGAVADLYQQNRNFKSLALPFYLQCTIDPDIVAQIRAVCFERAQRLSQELQAR